MTLTKLHLFLFWKLPSAWFCGVRAQYIDDDKAITFVRHRWINQNPFRSLYFAVQNMAAELSTGILVMKSIKEQNVPISMLVIETNSKFYKKATGKIRFECLEGKTVMASIEHSVTNDTSAIIHLPVKAYNMDDILVSEFSFTWSVKPKVKN